MLMSQAHVRAIMHSLTLLHYRIVYTHEPWYNKGNANILCLYHSAHFFINNHFCISSDKRRIRTNIFLISLRNTFHGYSLEAPQGDASEYPKHVFLMNTPTSFFVVK